MNYNIAGQEVKLCFQTLSEKTLRMCVLPVGESVKDVFATFDLDAREWEEPSTVLNGEEGVGTLQVGGYTVSVQASPLCVSFTRRGKLVQKLALSEEDGTVSFPTGKRALYGLGHGYHEHPDRRGGDYDLRKNGQLKGYHENYSAISPTPYVISAEGWALYFHQPWKGDIDLRGETGCFRKYPPQYCDVFVVDCEEPMDAPREYYSFTGLPPMPKGVSMRSSKIGSLPPSWTYALRTPKIDPWVSCSVRIQSMTWPNGIGLMTSLIAAPLRDSKGDRPLLTHLARRRDRAPAIG